MPRRVGIAMAILAVIVLVLPGPLGYAETTAAPRDGKKAARSDSPGNRLREGFRRFVDQQYFGAGATGSSDRYDRTRQDPDRKTSRFVRRIRARIYKRIENLIRREFGPLPDLQTESVMLDAMDSKGRTMVVPFNAVGRPLRSLSVPANASKACALLGTDNLALALYDALPNVVKPNDTRGYWRIYTGDDAQALAAEAKLVVSLKGGEWREPRGKQAVANVVAVRGLDLDRGLGPNGNKTYDDTMYVVVDSAGVPTEVYEYRMTTESSSTSPGVGRLSSMQVIYVRGLHRGKDPGYRLKGDVAYGTRTGVEGTQQILGANIHSAYAKRVIDSTTPLDANVSLGCQVVASSKRDFEETLVFLLDKKGIKEFPYTIIEGDELAMLDRTLNERGKHSLLVEGIPRKVTAAS